MSFVQRTVLSLVATCAVFLYGATAATATPINIDFGRLPNSIPSSTFGAASGQAGFWNDIQSSFIVNGLRDLSGNVTGINLTLVAFTLGGTDETAPDGDGADLMEDNFYSFPNEAWALTLTGLADGLYDVFLYEPHNSAVGTGAGNVNGVAFNHITGNFAAGVFLEGQNFHHLTGVSVSGGLLTAGGSSVNFSGLSGLQLVQASPAAVPEPATLLMLGSGLAGVYASRRRRRRN
jgi:hypothetical protein